MPGRPGYDTGYRAGTKDNKDGHAPSRCHACAAHSAFTPPGPVPGHSLQSVRDVAAVRDMPRGFRRRTVSPGNPACPRVDKIDGTRGLCASGAGLR
jgi:hypothetical protein